MRREGRPHGGPRSFSLVHSESKPREGRTSGAGWPLVELRRVPTGELHPFGKCAWCGSSASVRPTTLRVTMAPAYVCEDSVTCARAREVAGRAA